MTYYFSTVSSTLHAWLMKDCFRQLKKCVKDFCSEPCTWWCSDSAIWPLSNSILMRIIPSSFLMENSTHILETVHLTGYVFTFVVCSENLKFLFLQAFDNGKPNHEGLKYGWFFINLVNLVIPRITVNRRDKVSRPALRRFRLHINIRVNQRRKMVWTSFAFFWNKETTAFSTYARNTFFRNINRSEF